MGEARRKGGKLAGLESTSRKPLDEIQGFSFGDILTDAECISVNMHIRANASRGGREGTRGIILLHGDQLKQLIEGLPMVINALREAGGDRDVLPPPAGPLPPWDAGPRFNSLSSAMHLCTLFGVRDIAPERGAAVMVISATSYPHVRGKSDSADYLMGWSALLEFQEALPKALALLEPHLKGRFRPH